MNEGETGPNPLGIWDVEETEFSEEKQGSCFWGHKWTKWEQCSHSIWLPRQDKQLNGVPHQKRTCLRCGKIQEEEI